jgi:hypothetical protein
MFVNDAGGVVQTIKFLDAAGSSPRALSGVPGQRAYPWPTAIAPSDAHSHSALLHPRASARRRALQRQCRISAGSIEMGKTRSPEMRAGLVLPAPAKRPPQSDRPQVRGSAYWPIAPMPEPAPDPCTLRSASCCWSRRQIRRFPHLDHRRRLRRLAGRCRTLRHHKVRRPSDNTCPTTSMHWPPDRRCPRSRPACS